jgi:hypothetical protein
MMLVLGNALSYFLEEGKGVISQGETFDHQIHKFAVYRMKGKIRAALIDHLENLEVGTKFYIDSDISEQILKAAINGGEYIIEKMR